MKIFFRIVVVFMLPYFSCALAEENEHYHGGHVYAPIGIMGDHIHGENEWMFTYSYKTMKMEENLDGKNKVSTSEVLADFMVAPTSMTMQMHMFGTMYGVSEKLMVMGMLPYSLISMDHINRKGEEFTTKSEGFGDLKLSGVYAFYEQGPQKFLFDFGVSLPTGSIDKRGDTPVGDNQRLPYSMQLGSGTYDLLPGFTYTDQDGLWSWGGQTKATVRTGKNDNNYRLGNEYNLTAWTTRKINRYLNSSLRIDGKSWKNIKGNDSELNPALVPTGRTDLRGGERVDVLLGFDVMAPDGRLKGSRFGFEAGFPIYQNLRGPQLATDFLLSVACQVVF